MPFKIMPIGKKFMLKNMNTGKRVDVRYNSKNSAAGAGRRFIAYRERVPAVYNPRLSTVVPVKKKKKVATRPRRRGY